MNEPKEKAITIDWTVMKKRVKQVAKALGLIGVGAVGALAVTSKLSANDEDESVGAIEGPTRRPIDYCGTPEVVEPVDVD